MLHRRQSFLITATGECQHFPNWTYLPVREMVGKEPVAAPTRDESVHFEHGHSMYGVDETGPCRRSQRGLTLPHWIG